MSDRHAATPPFAIEIAPEIGAVPASVEAFQAALKAERDNVLAELQASLHEQNEAYRHALRSELHPSTKRNCKKALLLVLPPGSRPASQRRCNASSNNGAWLGTRCLAPAVNRIRANCSTKSKPWLTRPPALKTSTKGSQRLYKTRPAPNAATAVHCRRSCRAYRSRSMCRKKNGSAPAARPWCASVKT